MIVYISTLGSAGRRSRFIVTNVTVPSESAAATQTEKHIPDLLLVTDVIQTTNIIKRQ